MTRHCSSANTENNPSVARTPMLQGGRQNRGYTRSSRGGTTATRTVQGPSTWRRRPGPPVKTTTSVRHLPSPRWTRPTHFRMRPAATGQHGKYISAFFTLGTLSSINFAESLVTPLVSVTSWFQAGLCPSRDMLIAGDGTRELEASSDVRPWAWYCPEL